MKRAILLVFSDPHGGHKLGLMNPAVELYQEAENGDLLPYKPEPTASQVYLWKLYRQGLAYTAQLAHGDPIAVIVNGDLTQGDKHPQMLVSTRRADQILIGIANLEPLFNLPSLCAVDIVCGTEAHNFNEGSSEIIIANTLKVAHPNHKVSVLYHGIADVSGLRVDYAHHGPPPGSRAWLKGNEARYYLRSVMMDEIMAGSTPPDLYLYAHYHAYTEERLTVQVGNRFFTSMLVTTPSFCMLGDYARKAARSPKAITNGMVAIEIIDGEIFRVHRLIRTLDIRTRKVLV